VEKTEEDTARLQKSEILSEKAVQKESARRIEDNHDTSARQREGSVFFRCKARFRPGVLKDESGYHFFLPAIRRRQVSPGRPQARNTV
jgi:hypothetical protein